MEILKMDGGGRQTVEQAVRCPPTLRPSFLVLTKTPGKHHTKAEPTKVRFVSTLNTTGSSGRSRDSTRTRTGTSRRRLSDLLANWTSFSSCVGKERPPRSSHQGADHRYIGPQNKHKEM